MIDVELEPDEILLIMRALTAMHNTERLEADEQSAMAALAFKLGGAMGEHLTGGAS
jgi:hypothetical protein